MTKHTLPTERILDQIHQRLYAHEQNPKRFHQDRRMLLYAITWPATWLEQRALPITAQHYEQLLTDRIDAIVTHGQPERYRDYVPAYLLKTIQQWFNHHGDTLYEQLKHIRNQLHSIDILLNPNRSKNRPEDIVTPLAQAHHILHRQKRRKHPPQPEVVPNLGQVFLFC